MFGKKNVAAVVAEFLGTAVLTVLILSVRYSSVALPFFIAAVAGLVIIIMMVALIDVSGANFNPALTLALWTARKASTARTAFYIAAQLLGGWVAYYLFTYLINTKLPAVGGNYNQRVLVAEALGAGIFAFVWAAAMFQKQSNAIRASIAGIGFMIGIIVASSFASSISTMGIINPAVALGVRTWVWGTYVLGPVLGAVIGVNIYSLLFVDNKGQKSMKTSFANVAASFSGGNKKVVSSKATTKKKPASRRSTSKK